MKTLIASALIATSFAGAAAAMTSVSNEAQLLVPGGNFSTLSQADIDTINGITRSGDSGAEKRAQIKRVLR